jgi:hypothetical protein
MATLLAAGCNLPINLDKAYPVDPKDERLGFKGIRLGDAISRYDGKNGFTCQAEEFGQRTCVRKRDAVFVPDSIAEQPIDWILLQFVNNGLARIVLQVRSEHFQAVRDALSEKYGPPAVEKQHIQNRMGARFENDVDTWRRAGGKVVLLKYGNEITHSLLIYKTDQFDAQNTKQNDQVTKHRANDL